MPAAATEDKYDNKGQSGLSSSLTVTEGERSINKNSCVLGRCCPGCGQRKKKRKRRILLLDPLIVIIEEKAAIKDKYKDD